jgi:hypothetical protein
MFHIRNGLKQGDALSPLLFNFALGYAIEHTEVREYLLLFGAESFVFQVAIQNLKDQDIFNYNFARCSVWV